MKRVKNFVKIVEKNTVAIYAILFLIIIGLIFYIFVDNSDVSKTTKYSQIRVNNDLGDSTVCKSSAIRNDTTNILIRFCGTGQVFILDSSDVSTTATESEATVTEWYCCYWNKHFWYKYM